MEQKPSIGRVVHYKHKGQNIAAIITEILSDTKVCLTAFFPSSSGEDAMIRIEAEQGDLDNQWQWPERV